MALRKSALHRTQPGVVEEDPEHQLKAVCQGIRCEQLAAAAPPGTQFIRVDGARHMESLTRTDVQRRVLEAMVAAMR